MSIHHKQNFPSKLQIKTSLKKSIFFQHGIFCVPSCQPSFPVACPGVQGHTAGIDPKTGPTSLRRGWKTPQFFGGNKKKATKSRLVKWICKGTYIYICMYRVCQKYYCCCYYSPSRILKIIETTSQLVGKKNAFQKYDWMNFPRD